MKFMVTVALGLALAFSGCKPKPEPAPVRGDRADSCRPMDSLRIVLVAHAGTHPIDRQIIQLQNQLRQQTNALALEQLGWGFVAKARESFDPGYYKLAEHCALVLQNETVPEALLLRGHALHNLHRFKEAERLARDLVTQRGLPCDWGLLTDTLTEQGRLDEAVAACQRMVDLRPDLHSYIRAAHLRWLKGDLQGAIELMRMAASAASPRAAEIAAWVQTRLAIYLLQADQLQAAQAGVELALQLQPDYPPALLAQGRIELAANQPGAAVEPLQKAAHLNPMPEYEWTLAEALHAANRAAEAAVVEARLQRRGATSDPRTLALYLATRQESPTLAMSLAQKELASRADVFTHDALAWSYARAGETALAARHIEEALAEGTQDGRLFFHAAWIALAGNRPQEAADWAARAEKLEQTLLPSERAQLRALVAQISNRSAGRPGPQRVDSNPNVNDFQLHPPPCSRRREEVDLKLNVKPRLLTRPCENSSRCLEGGFEKATKDSAPFTAFCKSSTSVKIRLLTSAATGVDFADFETLPTGKSATQQTWKSALWR